MSVHPRSRESIFAGSADLYRGDAAAVCSPNLRECVLAMEDCAEEVRQYLGLFMVDIYLHRGRLTGL